MTTQMMTPSYDWDAEHFDAHPNTDDASCTLCCITLIGMLPDELHDRGIDDDRLALLDPTLDALSTLSRLDPPAAYPIIDLLYALDDPAPYPPTDYLPHL